MVFQKRREKSGGRKKGTPNRATESIKNALDALLPEHEFVALWNKFLQHKNPHIAFEAFKLANYYMFGKPVTIVAGAEEPPPITRIIGAFREVSPLFLAPSATDRCKWRFFTLEFVRGASATTPEAQSSSQCVGPIEKKLLTSFHPKSETRLARTF